MSQSFVLFDVPAVVVIHDRVVQSHELQGLARDKSLEGVLDRVHNRLYFGFIEDVFDLASCYGAFIAKGHCFNDANKRTAATAVFISLQLNDIALKFRGVALGDWIVDLVTDRRSEAEFAKWLRKLAKV